MKLVLVILGILTIVLFYVKEYSLSQVEYYSGLFLNDKENTELARKVSFWIDASKVILVSVFCIYLFWAEIICLIIAKVLGWT